MLRNESAIRIWLIFGLAVLILLAACAPSKAEIKVEPSVSTAKVNDIVKIPIKVENVANLTAIEVHLSFNPTVLEVQELKDGGLLKPDFTVQNTFDNTAGTLDYAVAQMSGSPAKGSGTLIEIVFRAKANGDSLIRFRGTDAAPSGALLSDPNGMAIQISPVNGIVNIK